MDSAPALLRVVALLLPAAWRLLLLRAVDSEDPDAHWRCLLTPLEFVMLQQAVPKANLPDEATASEVVAAVAKLGGHLRRNGRPGWQTLQAGLHKLHELTAGAKMLQAARAVAPGRIKAAMRHEARNERQRAGR